GVGSGGGVVGEGVVFLPDLACGGAASVALSPAGIALALAGSAVIAVGAGVGRQVMRGADPLAITTLALGAAILPMTALTLGNGGFASIVSAPTDVHLRWLYLGI